MYIGHHNRNSKNQQYVFVNCRYDPNEKCADNTFYGTCAVNGLIEEHMKVIDKLFNCCEDPYCNKVLQTLKYHGEQGGYEEIIENDKTGIYGIFSFECKNCKTTKKVLINNFNFQDIKLYNV